ncbi:uncharacterized protein LOC113283706 [Papaver somniferum]|uniref:uncharacterized protein LOC113283706 n=1 Tax=Papaver somniferum TaxID=3469 RepID=UPI000E6FAB1F|nr:uncharacterized protein LOC113283706 [Papaver somniferum]
MAARISILLIDSFLLFAVIFIMSSSVEMVSAQVEECESGVSKYRHFADSKSCAQDCPSYCNPDSDKKLDGNYVCENDGIDGHTCLCCELPVVVSKSCKEVRDFQISDNCFVDCPPFCEVEREDTTRYACITKEICNCCGVTNLKATQ